MLQYTHHPSQPLDKVQLAAPIHAHTMDAFAVIGGEGFVGHALVAALHAKYPKSAVLSLDLVQRHYPDKGQWTYVSCDLTASSTELAAVFTQHAVSCVIHTASPWVGSPKAVCEKVNVQGTANVLEACRRAGVKKLVYTSSAGVVYDGHDIINVDERCTYPEKALDPYNDTKVRKEGRDGRGGEERRGDGRP